MGFGWKQPNAAEHYLQRAEQGLTYSWNGAYDLIRHMEKFTVLPPDEIVGSLYGLDDLVSGPHPARAAEEC
jgi:hypothetical protein